MSHCCFDVSDSSESTTRRHGLKETLRIGVVEPQSEHSVDLNGFDFDQLLSRLAGCQIYDLSAVLGFHSQCIIAMDFSTAFTAS